MDTEPKLNIKTYSKVFIRVSFVGVLIGLVLFLSAGTFRWDRGWILLILIALGFIANFILLRSFNPELLLERLKNVKVTKRFDKFFMIAYHPMPLFLCCLAGLDAVRFRWSHLPRNFFFIGIIEFLAAFSFISWAMVKNRFLSPTVSIQKERGHRVIDSGPYRIVRHPMYLGMMIMLNSWPAILGTCWAYVVWLVIVGLFVFRTHFEDKTLRKELQGYEEFTRATPYKLVPYIW